MSDLNLNGLTQLKKFTGEIQNQVKIYLNNPSIESFAFNSVDNFPQEFNHLTVNQFPNLKNINFSYSKPTTDTIENLFNAAPNITYFKLDHYRIFGLFENLPNIPLTQLKEINCKYSSISEKDVTWLLKMSPFLKKIVLENKLENNKNILSESTHFFTR